MPQPGNEAPTKMKKHATNERYVKGGSKRFRENREENAELNESLETLHEFDPQLYKVEDNNIIVPDASSELADFMEPYPESTQEPPKYESHVRSPRGSGLALIVHSFVGLRFTGVHPRTHRIGRYYLRAGFGSQGNEEESGYKGWQPGGLHNDTYSVAEISVERNTDPEHVNQALKFIPAHAHNSNYNLLSHNCNHFAREVAQELGFQDIAAMHEGISPTAAYSKMASLARQTDEQGQGDTRFFADLTAKNDIEDGSFTDMPSLRYANVQGSENGHISALSETMLHGGTDDNLAAEMPVTRAGFEEQANQALEAHGLGVFNWRVNDRGQFSTKNQARAEISQTAQEISAVENAMRSLKLSELYGAQGAKKDAALARKEQAKNTMAQAAGTTRNLMRKAGKRYYKLGIYALRVSTSFTHLIARMEAVAGTEGYQQIDRITDTKSFVGSPVSDAELAGLFSAQRSDRELRADRINPNQPVDDVDVQLGKYDVDQGRSNQLPVEGAGYNRGDFILSHLPGKTEQINGYLRGRSQQYSQQRKQNIQRGQGLGAQDRAFVIETLSTLYDRIKLMAEGNERYMRAVMSLFRQRQQRAFTPEQAALLIMREMLQPVNQMVLSAFGYRHEGALNDLNGMLGNLVGTYRFIKNQNMDQSNEEIANSIPAFDSDFVNDAGINAAQAQVKLSYLALYQTLEAIARPVAAQQEGVHA